MTQRIRAAWLVLMLTVAGCGGSTISAEQLRQRLGEHPTILDVRSANEFRRDHVPGARHAPVGEVAARAAALGLPKDAPVILYCEHGPRAYMARSSLEAAGWSHVILLEGHMTHWRSAGFPVETGEPAAPTPQTP